MKQWRSDAVVASVSDRLYVCGGYHAGEFLSSAERFDPEKATWEALPSMARRRTGAVVAVLWS